jgi:hypothetical protein
MFKLLNVNLHIQISAHTLCKYEYFINKKSTIKYTTFCGQQKEAANTVRAPDDERRTARNMLNL